MLEACATTTNRRSTDFARFWRTVRPGDRSGDRWRAGICFIFVAASMQPAMRVRPRELPRCTAAASHVRPMQHTSDSGRSRSRAARTSGFEATATTCRTTGMSASSIGTREHRPAFSPSPRFRARSGRSNDAPAPKPCSFRSNPPFTRVGWMLRAAAGSDVGSAAVRGATSMPRGRRPRAGWNRSCATG